MKFCKINEQINSVRRELSNLLSVGIIKSEANNNRLYYEVSQDYEFYSPLAMIFGGAKLAAAAGKPAAAKAAKAKAKKAKKQKSQLVVDETSAKNGKEQLVLCHCEVQNTKKDDFEERMLIYF